MGRLRVPGFTYVLTEKTFSFDPTVLDAPRDVYLDGYWQSEKYFKEIDPIIREEFALNSSMSECRRNWPNGSDLPNPSA